MAGVTDTPSRYIAQLFEPGLVVSEMIASSQKDKYYFEKSVKACLQSKKNETNICPTAIQIAGHEIEWMSYAAQVIEFEGGDLIDINMGCPAKKIVGRLSGSALMKEPTHALRMIDSIVKSTTRPVTLKMRLGWDIDSINAPMIAKSAEETGVQMITIHARTRNQFFKGKPDWKSVKAVKDVVSIPIIINGDIIDTKSATEALQQSNADGIMVGRGAIGKPWLLKELSKSLYCNSEKNMGCEVQLYKLVILHLSLILSHYGRVTGLKMFRKHLVKYLSILRLKPNDQYRFMTEESIERLKRMIRHNFNEQKVKILHGKYVV